MKLKLHLNKIYDCDLQNYKTEKIAVENFAYKEKTIEYQETLSKLEKDADFSNLDAKGEWDKITELCKKAGVETLGQKTKNQAEKDPEIQNLKEESQKIRLKLTSITDEDLRKDLRK